MDVSNCLPATTSKNPRNELRVGSFGNALSDAQLVHRARNGDGWAIEVLFRRYIRPLTNFARTLVRNRHDADDLVQDAFAEGLRDLLKLRTPSAFRSWLFAILVHRSRRLHRRRKLVRMLGFGSGEGEVDLANIAGTNADQETLGELRIIDQSLQRCSFEHRIAWLLRVVQGESLSTVAAMTGCSLATVKRRISRVQQTILSDVEGAACV